MKSLAGCTGVFESLGRGDGLVIVVEGLEVGGEVVKMGKKD